MMKLRKNQKGFTLVELLIVVIILGILAAIALPRFLNAREKARTRACQSNLSAINAAIEEYALRNDLTTETEIAAISIDTITGDIKYFPDGPPNCPTGGTYSINANGRATCSEHGSLADWESDADSGTGGGGTGQ